MSNKRDLKLDSYDISTYRYRELSNFCYQYPEWLRKLHEINQEINIHSPSCEVASGNGSADSKVEKMAIKAVDLKANIELIKKAALKAAGEDLAEYIILSVTTHEINYRYLSTIKEIPCSRSAFFRIRRKFFYILAQLKG